MNALQTDTLQEIANIGAGHAATALAQMTGWRVSIDVPRVHVGGEPPVTAGFAVGNDELVAMWTEIRGDLGGRTSFLLHLEEALWLAGAMLGGAGDGNGLDDMRKSALQELGNVMTSSFLNALASVGQWYLIPSPPTVKADLTANVCAAIEDSAHNRSLVVDTRMHFHAENDSLVAPPPGTIGGLLVLGLPTESMEAILTKLLPTIESHASP